MSSSRFLASRLSRKILSRTILVFLAALVAVAVVSFHTVGNDSRSRARSALDNAILQIEKVLTDVQSSTAAVAAIVQKYHADSTAMSFLVRRALEADSTIVTTAIAFEPGRSVASDRLFMTVASRDGDAIVSRRISDDATYEYTVLDWYQIPRLLGRAWWGDPSYDTAGGDMRMVTTYSVPLYDEDGEFLGVMRSDVSLEWLTDVMERFKPYESAVTLLVGHNGSFITHRDRDRILNETIFTDALDSGSEKMIAACRRVMDGETGDVDLLMDGKGVKAFFSPLQNGWRMVGICSLKDLYSSVNRINMILAIIAALGLLTLYFASKRVISRITQPITEFTYSALTMSKGNFLAKIPDVDSNDEIRRLHDSMNYLQRSVNKYITELKATSSAKERIESELAIATQIQNAILPHSFPDARPYDIFASVSAAREVGGDLFDFREKDGSLYFMIGDVSGKGVPAALYMSIVCSSFRLVNELGVGMADAVSKINDVFSSGNDSGMFVTLFAGRIDLATLRMEYCNAGHNPMVVVGPDGNARYHKCCANIAAGLFPGFAYEPETLQLEKGTRLLLYTDGVTEAEKATQEQYGEDRLLAFAASAAPSLSSREFAEALVSDVRSFTSGNAQNDDITVFCITV